MLGIQILPGFNCSVFRSPLKVGLVALQIIGLHLDCLKLTVLGLVECCRMLLVNE